MFLFRLRTELETGTYGNRAIREIPKPKRGRRRGRGRGGPTSHTPRRPQAPPSIPEEPGSPKSTPEGGYSAPVQYAQASSKPRYAWPGMERAYTSGGSSTAGSAYQSYQSAPPSRRGGHFQAPADPRMDARRYAPRVETYPVAGATHGAKSDSFT